MCRFLRETIIQETIYKRKLDSICRAKGINNYMALSPLAREGKSLEEQSSYYKMRLYKYVNRNRLVHTTVEEDKYIETYRKSQEDRKKKQIKKWVCRSL